MTPANAAAAVLLATAVLYLVASIIDLRAQATLAKAVFAAGAALWTVGQALSLWAAR